MCRIPGGKVELQGKGNRILEKTSFLCAVCGGQLEVNMKM